MHIYNNLFSVANAPIGVIFGSWNVHASRAFRETMENARILFARPLKLKQCICFVFFGRLVNLAWGFSLERVYNPNMVEMLFRQCQCMYN